MEVASTAIAVIEVIVKKCEEIKALPEDCNYCANFLKKLYPIVKEISSQLKTREHKNLSEELNRSLYDVETVIDYIAKHPKYTKLFSSSYLEKLHSALNEIDLWIGRIQTVGLSITHQSHTILSGLQQDIKSFITVLHSKLNEVTNKVDSLQIQVQNGNAEIISLLKDGLADAPVKEKGGRFEDFIVEEELRQIRILESEAAKVLHIPKPLLCPITLEVMNNPMMNIISGYTYDDEALRNHMSQCMLQRKPITDPITQEEFNPQIHLKLNRAIADMLAEWKAEHMNGEIMGSSFPPPLPPPAGYTNSSNESATSPVLKHSSNKDTDLVEEGSRKSQMSEDNEEVTAFNKFKSWFTKELGFTGKVAEQYVHLFYAKNISGVDRLKRVVNRNKTCLTEWDIERFDAEDILEKLFPEVEKEQKQGVEGKQTNATVVATKKTFSRKQQHIH